MKTAPGTTSTRPRVCIVGSGWRFLSGISLYTCRMANQLAEEGYPVSAILMRRLLPRRLYPGRDRVGATLTELRYSDQVTVFDGVDYFWVPSLWRAARQLHRERPDVIVFEWWTSTVVHSYLALALLGRLLGSRIVIEFHETLDTGEAQVLLARRYAEMMLRPLLSLAAGFAVHSEYDRREVTRRYPLRDKPVTVVTHGPYDHFVPSDRAPGRAGGVCRLLSFGTIRPYKGVEHLLEAFDRLTDSEVAQFHLTVVGETWEDWTLPAEMIERSRHRDRISFVNRYVTDAEARDFFDQADAVVLPYIRSSASGPLHIAMSYGLPVIVTAVGGLTEVADCYEGARQVPPGDVESLRTAMLKIGDEVGKRYADPFSWGAAARQLSTLFEPEPQSSPATCEEVERPPLVGARRR